MHSLIPDLFWQKYQTVLNKDEFNKFKAACLKPLRKSIRVNTLKVSVAEFKKIAKKLNWQLSPIPWCKTGFWIDRDDRSEPLGKSYLHLAGYFYIQEASSMIPPEFLNLKTGEMVLDMASAPGSKTTQMAGIMANTGLIIANEPQTDRIKAMSSNLDRLGVSNVLLTQKDGRAFSQYFPNFFDKILLDAPCSGEGCIRKDKLCLEHWNDKKVGVMAKLQQDLITHAFLALKPGGTMVYSTCTLSPEENENIIQFLLSNFAGNAKLMPIKKAPINEYGLNGVLRVWPQTYDTEGFFIAKIKKQFPTATSNFQQNRRNSPFTAISLEYQHWLNKICSKMFDFKIKDFSQMWQLDKQIWIRPSKCELINQMMIINKGGILLGERHHQDIQFTHEGGLFLPQIGNIPSKGIIDLNDEEMKLFQQGFDIEKSHAPQWVFFRYNKVFVGIGKAMGDKIKNKLPRHLILN